MAGKSHYPLRKMLALAFDGITSLSVKPIRLITGLGVIISVLAFLLILYALISWIARDGKESFESLWNIVMSAIIIPK